MYWTHYSCADNQWTNHLRELTVRCLANGRGLKRGLERLDQGPGFKFLLMCFLLFLFIALITNMDLKYFFSNSIDMSFNFKCPSLFLHLENWKRWLMHKTLFLFFSLNPNSRTFSLIFRGGRGGEREKYQCVTRAWNQTRNLLVDLCSDQEWIPRPFGIQEEAPTNWATGKGWTKVFLSGLFLYLLNEHKALLSSFYSICFPFSYICPLKCWEFQAMS